MKEAVLRNMFKKALRSSCTSTVVESSNSLSAIPPSSSGVKTPENTEQCPGVPEPSDGDIQTEYSSD
jgi:hypothetical protein